MSKFNDILTELRHSVQGLVNETNVDAIARIAKNMDSLEAEYKTAETEKQEAKENLVKYVKEYAFKEKGKDETETALPPSLDEAIENAFKE